MFMQINGSASALYDYQQVNGNNTTVAAFAVVGATSCLVGESAAASATAGACSTWRISIPNYTGTAFWKVWDANHTLSTGSAVTSMHAKAWAGQYRATGAVTGVNFFLQAGNYVAGSTFTLYGLL